MTDERSPTAFHNAGKDDEKSDASNANYSDAFDAPDAQGVMGPGKGEQHRAPADEGIRAPLAQETGGNAQFSSFDGKGNERVVVLSENEAGQPAQGTGKDAASAQAAAESGESQIGDMGADE